MADLKTVSLSGVAASDYTGGKKSRRSSKRKQDGGSATAVQHIDLKGIECPTSVAHSAGSANPATWLSYPRGAPVPPAVHPAMHGGKFNLKKVDNQPTTVVTEPKIAIAEETTGGTRHIKVELKKRTSSKKVQLHPKKIESAHAKKHQTKKGRKLTIGLSSFRKRLTRANKLHKRMSTMPLAELKAHLISKKLIKPTSKAPESVLRQIAADSQIVTEKSL
jgi:hypothetical protein